MLSPLSGHHPIDKPADPRSVFDCDANDRFPTYSGHDLPLTPRVIDVAVDLVIVIKCKMVPLLIGLVASCLTIACYSWTVVTALCTHAIFILAMTWKPYTLPRESAVFQLWSFGTGDEKSNAGTASPRLNDSWDTRASLRLPNDRFRPIAVISFRCKTSYMRNAQTFLVVLGLLSACSNEDIPPERLLAQNDLCLDREKWAAVIDYSREFGAKHDFRLEGGAESFEGEGLNVALLKGGSWFDGPELTLWVTSDPFRDRTANFSAISRAVMKDSERALARNYLQGVVQLGCKTTSS